MITVQETIVKVVPISENVAVIESNKVVNVTVIQDGASINHQHRADDLLTDLSDWNSFNIILLG